MTTMEICQPLQWPYLVHDKELHSVQVNQDSTKFPEWSLINSPHFESTSCNLIIKIRLFGEKLQSEIKTTEHDKIVERYYFNLKNLFGDRWYI
jgi:hypothetical protein